MEHRSIAKRSISPSHHHQRRLNGDNRVVWSEQQRAKSRQKRDFTRLKAKSVSKLLNDPKWSSMWYLNVSMLRQHLANVIKKISFSIKLLPFAHHTASAAPKWMCAWRWCCCCYAHCKKLTLYAYICKMRREERKIEYILFYDHFKRLLESARAMPLSRNCIAWQKNVHSHSIFNRKSMCIPLYENEIVNHQYKMDKIFHFIYGQSCTWHLRVTHVDAYDFFNGFFEF